MSVNAEGRSGYRNGLKVGDSESACFTTQVVGSFIAGGICEVCPSSPLISGGNLRHQLMRGNSGLITAIRRFPLETPAAGNRCRVHHRFAQGAAPIARNMRQTACRNLIQQMVDAALVARSLRILSKPAVR